MENLRTANRDEQFYIENIDSTAFADIMVVESKILRKCVVDKGMLYPFLQTRGAALRHLAYKVIRGYCSFDRALTLVKEDIDAFTA